MEPIAFVQFAGGAMRPVFEDDDGRQYVVADDGVRVFGLWYIPRDEGVSPIVVEADQAHRPLANF